MFSFSEILRHTRVVKLTQFGSALPFLSRSQLKYDVTRSETRFRLSAKRTSPFKSADGRQFSRLLAAEVGASSVVMLDTPCSEVVGSAVLVLAFVK